MEFRKKLLPKINGTENILQKAAVISDGIYAHMKYRKGVTDVGTTAEEAMEKGMGVCQDYAHIFLSLCRSFGIRCRYVSGLACENGETHSWAEVNDGEKWYGIDPANNRSINENYIKICHGRDYADCPIERGIYRSFVQTGDEFSKGEKLCEILDPLEGNVIGSVSAPCDGIVFSDITVRLGLKILCCIK